MGMASEPSAIEEFLLSHGGPFFELQRRLRMLREDALLAGRRAAIFVGLAWGVPLVLSLLEGHAIGPADSRPYLFDTGAWARFFIATGLFLLTEEEVEQGLRAKLAQFARAPLLAPNSFEAAAIAVSTALRRRNSGLAEMLCLAGAIVATLPWLFQLMGEETSTWAAQIADGRHRIMLAGWWSLIFSMPLFNFLLLRGLWRYVVWALLLSRIAPLDLRLVATHPDGNAGLGFISEYPNAYAMFVFGLSSAIAVPVVGHVFESDVSSVTFGYILGGWLAIVLAVFAFPLLAFVRPLSVLKENTLQLLSSQATRYCREAERALLGSNVVADDPAEADPDHPAADPSAQLAAVHKLSVFLLSRTSLAPLAASALIPFAIVGATKLPYKEVFSLVKKLLVL